MSVKIKAPILMSVSGIEMPILVLAPVARTDDEEETVDVFTIAFPVCIGEITIAADEFVVAGEPVAEAIDCCRRRRRECRRGRSRPKKVCIDGNSLHHT
jgi:hypothetical protein